MIRIFEEEKVPKTWEVINLESVCEINPKLNKSNYQDDLQVSFVPMPAVDAESGKIDVSGIRSFSQVKKGYTAFQKHDVLFAKITPCMENGKMAVVPAVTNGLGFGSTEFHVLRAGVGINPHFIYYFVSSKIFRVQAEHNMTGAVGQRRVPAPWLSAEKLPLPPEKEQHRIVAKIEELFSYLDKGIESLKTAQKQLKVYRQALLKYAFEGKLTEQWRRDNPYKLESAEQLLERIKQEREEHYFQRLEEWKTAVETWEENGKEGKKPTKPRKPKDYSPLTDEILKSINELPIGWKWEKLGWMSTGVGYGTSAKSASDGSHPVLRMGNIQQGKFVWDDLVFSSDKDEIEKYLLNPGDVLFNRTNSPELVGKTAIFRGEKEALFAGYLIRINHSQRVINSQYLNLYLNSYRAKQYGNSVKTDGVNQSNINGDKLSNYPFPYCSIDEQKIIVSHLEQKLSSIDRLEEDLKQNLLKAYVLRQSTLKKAFSGQLVSQDPNDEPANKLLKRIVRKKAQIEAEAKADKAATRKTTKRQAKLNN
ncbi:restriction endonuclease subunit S [Thalassotalea sp. ND16A]|uniref:restriction endonuclease subunit S n=1 Tax=Thalassotalea sp. ND16A TaxID=1535422 RepID=UPI00051D830D|nr:restriction endonuclease subunit S [Thalassotalea sp. ND16A]KGK00168.1 hypothetical protein ND16A_3639 [Thalassotalea sp. ND16A]